MRGSYSIDPAVFDDGNGNYYMYFGGLWGGQLQRYRNNKALEWAAFPADGEPALPSRVVKTFGRYASSLPKSRGLWLFWMNTDIR